MTEVFKLLSDEEKTIVIELCNLNETFFEELTFVKRNLTKFKDKEYGEFIESFSIEDCNKKTSKVIYKDDNYYYKIYLSSENFYLSDTIYMYNKDILHDFTPNLQYIKNSKNEVIGYKQDIINNNMELVDKEDLIEFYKSFSIRMRDCKMCFFDISSPNLGFVEMNNKKIVKLLDIDITCAANILFPHIEPIPEISSIARYWHKTSGIEKYDSIMKTMNLNSFCSTNMYS